MIAPMTMIAPSNHGHQTVPSSSSLVSSVGGGAGSVTTTAGTVGSTGAVSAGICSTGGCLGWLCLGWQGAGIAARRRHHRTDRWERGRYRRTGTAGVGPAGTDQHDDRGNTEQTKSHSGMVVDRAMSERSYRWDGSDQPWRSVDPKAPAVVAATEAVGCSPLW